MKPETVEALLIDRAMGELTPEAAELLEAHLAGDPDGARRVGGLAAVVQQARQAVALAEEAPPPLAIARLQQARRDQRQRAFLGELSRLAACLALGLALGWYGRPTHAAAAVAAAPVVAASPAVSAAAQPRPLEPAQDFWSLARLEAVQQEHQPAETRATSRYRLHWDSPVKMPHLEDNL